MDTISSRESSGSPLPIVGVIAGVIGLVLGVVAIVKASNTNKVIEQEFRPKVEKIDAIEATANSANDAAAKVTRETASLRQSLTTLAKDAGDYMGGLRADVDALKEAQKKAPAAVAAAKGPVVAGPGEYVIKSGDNFTRIARANGVSVADLQAVNPSVNSSRLIVGQKIKLPKK